MKKILLEFDDSYSSVMSITALRHDKDGVLNLQTYGVDLRDGDHVVFDDNGCKKQDFLEEL